MRRNTRFVGWNLMGKRHYVASDNPDLGLLVVQKVFCHWILSCFLCCFLSLFWTALFW